MANVTYQSWLNVPEPVGPVPGETEDEKNLRLIHNIYYKRGPLGYFDLVKAQAILPYIKYLFLESRARILLIAIKDRYKTRSRTAKPLKIAVGHAPEPVVVAPAPIDPWLAPARGPWDYLKQLFNPVTAGQFYASEGKRLLGGMGMQGVLIVASLILVLFLVVKK